MDKISVVVATYNQSEYLPICLDSIWFQDHPDIEIVVVNDCSDDDTREVIEEYVKNVEAEETSYASNFNARANVVERTKHPRYPKQGRTLKVVHHEENKGLSIALNTGINVASGEYCTFIASDDMLLPSMCSTLLAAMKEADADFAYSDMHICDDNGRILRRFELPEYSFEDSFCNWYLCGICKLYKKELHDLHGYYSPEHVSQDHDMYLRFAMGGAKFVHVPRVLANVRIHSNERKVDNHSPANESRQKQDSSELVIRARDFLQSVSK